MKLMICSSALVIALLSIPAALAADSGYLEERMKRLHEKAATSTLVPATTPTNVEPGTTGTRAAPATVVTPDPWWR